MYGGGGPSFGGGGDGGGGGGGGGGNRFGESRGGRSGSSRFGSKSAVGFFPHLIQGTCLFTHRIAVEVIHSIRVLLTSARRQAPGRYWLGTTSFSRSATKSKDDV